MNLISCCHKCKEIIVHARGEEHKTMMPFYHRHRRCLAEDKYCMVTLEDQYQEEGWMRNDEYRNAKIGLIPLCSEKIVLSENATTFLVTQRHTRFTLFTLAKSTGGLRLRHEDGESIHYTINEISMVAANDNNLNVILRDGRMIPVGRIGWPEGDFSHVLKWLNRVNELIKSFMKHCSECGCPVEGWIPLSKITAQSVCSDIAKHGIDPETGHKMTCSKRRRLSVKSPHAWQSDGRLYESKSTIEIKGEQMDDVRVNRVLEEVTGVQVVKIDCDDYEKHGG